jgi:hypothetical protein
MPKMAPIYCLLAICVVPSTFTARVADEPFSLQDFVGPPHGTWSQSVACSLTLINSSPAELPPGAVQLVLRSRIDPRQKEYPLRADRSPALVPGMRQAMRLGGRLPDAPDPLGCSDGDYDLVVAIEQGGGRRLLDPAHPIHIETRDRAGKINGKYVPRVYDLVAANAAPGKPLPDWLMGTGIRNSRDSVAWGAFEPEDGKWDEKQFGPESPLGSLTLQARKYDMTTIPTLLNIPEWAQAQSAAGRRRGAWAPPADPARWAAFVDKVVGYYSKPPYCQRDWQIWNEAGELDKSHCFWDGTLAEYVETVHNPAARAIRKHFVGARDGRQGPAERCRVVYGGLPDTDAHEGGYAKVLDLRGCGDLTDILDAHYVSNLRWFADPGQSGDVYSRWVKTGKAQGCWITEDGWGHADKPEWTPGYYFNALLWALEHDWDHKDKYRVYFFHYYAAEEHKGFFWINNQRKWPNGYSIKTLMDLFQGDLAPVGPARKIETTAGVKLGAMIAGGRLLAMPFRENLGGEGRAHVVISLKPEEKVRSVSQITGVKGIETAVPFGARDNKLQFDVAWKKIDRSVEGMDDPQTPICYLKIECDQAVTTWR